MKENDSYRRSFLKAAGTGLGVSLVGVRNVAAATGYNTTLIDMTLPEDGGESKWTEEVPLEWYEHTQRAIEANEQFWSKYGDEPVLTDSGLKPSEEDIGGEKKQKIVPEVKATASADSLSLPSEIDGISVEPEAAKKTEETGCHGRFPADNMPGGVVIEGPQGRGTSCCRVKKNGTFYMLTALHLWPRCSYNVRGYRARQRGRQLGYVDRYTRALDYTAIKRDNNNGIYFKTKIQEPGRRIPADTVMSEFGVVHLANQRSPVVKMGITTGRTAGPINKHHINGGGPNCTDFNGFGVRVGATQAKGDSGGPVYLGGPDYHMISMASVGHNPRSNYTACGEAGSVRCWRAGQGVAAYKLYRNGFRFRV